MLIHIQLFVITWNAVHQASLSMQFSRQEYLVGLPFPSPGDLPDPGIQLMSPASPELQADFYTGPPGKLCQYPFSECSGIK